MLLNLFTRGIVLCNRNAAVAIPGGFWDVLYLPERNNDYAKPGLVTDSTRPRLARYLERCTTSRDRFIEDMEIFI